MYRPSWENRTSDIEDMISEKNERADGSSSCSNSASTVSVKVVKQPHPEGSPRTLSMLITKSTFPHICKLDGSFRAGIHEPIATLGMKLCCCNHFCKLLHISWFNIDDVKALILNVQVPQVYP